MSKQSKRGNKRVSSDEILQKGGLSQAEIEQGRRRQALQEVARLTNALTVIVTAGGEVLRRDFDFTVEQAADWAEMTIQAARELMADVRR